MKRLLLAIVICASLAAPAQDEERYRDLGNKIQCSCGCNQILLQCNHVGCPNSAGMIRELRTAVTTYKNDEDVLNWFRRSYGMTIVVAPATHGFELMIWVVPPLIILSAFALVFFLIQEWRARATPAPVVGVDSKMDELRARARKETEL